MQRLVKVLDIGPLGALASVMVPHGIVINGVSVAPRVINPDQATEIFVAAVTSTTVTFTNPSGAPLSAKFYCLYEHSFQRDPEDLATLFWQGASGGGGGGGPSSAIVSVTSYGCDAGVAVNDVVYLSAADTVGKGDADDPGKQPVIGFVRSKPDATHAIVQYYGELGGFIGLTPGATYFISTTPGLIVTPPPSGTGTVVQRVGFARNANTLMCMVDRDYDVL